MVPCMKFTTVLKQITAVVGVLLGMWVYQTVATTADPHHVQLCGPQLANMLEIVCAGRGFHFKRAASLEVNPSKRTGDLTVVAECCHRRCTIPTLETYCAASSGPSRIPQADIFGYLNGNDRRHTTHLASSTIFYPTTTMSSAHYDPNEPSAQVFRGPPAGSPNTAFFYVLRGSRPTRTPLIKK
ncbi:hypothetical protein ACOMHN_044105 [Nucella lapillus]